MMGDNTSSDFDMSLAMLERINGLLNIVAEAKLAMDFKIWRDSLVVISDEVAADYDKKTEEELTRALVAINPLIIRATPRFVFGNDRPQSKITGEEYNDLYLKIRELDKFVRRELNKRNLLISKNKDSEVAL